MTTERKRNLILKRKIGETLIIGDAEVTLLSHERGNIKLGIRAPDRVSVDRLEVWLQKLDERK